MFVLHANFVTALEGVIVLTSWSVLPITIVAEVLFNLIDFTIAGWVELVLELVDVVGLGVGEVFGLGNGLEFIGVTFIVSSPLHPLQQSLY